MGIDVRENIKSSTGRGRRRSWVNFFNKMTLNKKRVLFFVLRLTSMKIAKKLDCPVKTAVFFLCSILLSFSCWSQNPAQSPPNPSSEPIMGTETSAQQLFFCTTRIDATSADGKSTSSGTGFIFEYPAEDKPPLQTRIIPFLVTCKHVVNGFKSATFAFVKANGNLPELGQKCEFNVPDLQQIVFYDSDPTIDVALIPLNPLLESAGATEKKPFFRTFDKRLVPDREQAEDLSAIQSILFIGYPNGMRDEKNLLPLARRGFTASPYVVDFNALPLFLIDANVFPGSSGSPVLVLDEGTYTTKNGIISGGSRIYFLGMVSSAYFEPVEGEIEFKSVPSQFVPFSKEQRFLNIGGVIKAKAILSTMSKFVKAHPEIYAPIPKPYQFLHNKSF